jgi:hypothetical protein
VPTSPMFSAAIIRAPIPLMDRSFRKVAESNLVAGLSCVAQTRTDTVAAAALEVRAARGGIPAARAVG